MLLIMQISSCTVIVGGARALPKPSQPMITMLLLPILNLVMTTDGTEYAS